MKKVFAAAAMVAVLTAGAIFAHGRNGMEGFGPGQMMMPPQGKAPKTSRTVPPTPVEMTISGSLTLKSGHLSVVSGGKTFFVAGLQRWIGYIDGLKEGAAVTLKGYAQEFSATGTAAGTENRFHAYELTIGSKTYEVGQKWIITAN